MRRLMKKRRVLLSHVRQLMMMSMCVNVRMNDSGGGSDGVGGTGGVGRQRRLRLGRVKRVAVTCNQTRVAAGVTSAVSSPGSGPGRGPGRGPGPVSDATVR